MSRLPCCECGLELDCDGPQMHAWCMGGCDSQRLVTSLVNPDPKPQIIGYQMWPSDTVEIFQTHSGYLFTPDEISKYLFNANNIRSLQINSTWTAFYDDDILLDIHPITQMNRRYMSELELLGIEPEFPLWPVVGIVLVVRDDMVYIE